MSVQRAQVVHPDVDLHSFYSQGPRVLRRSWVVATAVGESVGFLVPALVAVLAFDLHPALTLTLMVLAGAAEGLVLGAAQAVVLHREFLGFSRSGWMAATSLGAATAWFLAMLAVTTSSSWTGWPALVTVPLGIVLGSALLASIGLAQWTVLRRHVVRSRSWVPASAVSWAVGLGVFFCVSTPLWHKGQPVLLVVTIGALGGVAMAFTVAVMTGLWLTRLACPPDGRPSGRRGPAGVPDRDWAALAEPTDEFRVFDPMSLDHLPAPVQRWMRHVLTPGVTMLTGVETEWTGHIRMGRTWRAFCSRQRASLHGGFVWSARTRAFGLPVVGYDRYARDEAEMRWRLLGRLRLVSESGEEVARSSAGRHAAELLASVPVVALDPSVRWEPVDERRATAHLVVAGEEQAVTVSVDPVGRLRQVEMDRWGTPPGSPFGQYRFGALLDEERRFDSYLVPTEVVAGWHIGTSRWDEGTFLRYRVVRCSFH